MASCLDTNMIKQLATQWTAYIHNFQAAIFTIVIKVTNTLTPYIRGICEDAQVMHRCSEI